MDAKITLSFDKLIIAKAKEYAKNNNMSLSRLTEYLFQKITSDANQAIYNLPIHDWVLQLAEGTPQYNRKAQSKKELRESFYGKYDVDQSASKAAEDPATYSSQKKKK